MHISYIQFVTKMAAACLCTSWAVTWTPSRRLSESWS